MTGYISSALAAALKNPTSSAFYVAPDRTAETQPDMLNFKDEDSVEVARIKRRVCRAAFRAAMAEILTLDQSEAYHNVQVADAKETCERYKIEEQKIEDTLSEFGMRYGLADHSGIRCLSHMRDKALSEDAKKLNEYLRQNLRFTTKEQVLYEAESWIRTRLKYTCSRYTFKHDTDSQSSLGIDRLHGLIPAGYSSLPAEP